MREKDEQDSGGFLLGASVTDVFARHIAGWRVSNTLRTHLALDALEMALRTRQDERLEGLVDYSDRGVQGGINWGNTSMVEVAHGDNARAPAGGSAL